MLFRSATIPSDPALVSAMDLARDVCNATLRVRKANQIRVRQPLSSLQVAVAGSAALAPFVDLLADEVNVKSVELSDDVAAVASFDLQVVPAALGPRLGGQTQQVIKAVKSGDWQRTAAGVTAGGFDLLDGEYSLRLVTKGDTASSPLSSGAGVVLLDTAVSPELEAEGLTRDLIRLVQQARRDAGLAVSDRIVLTLGVPEAVRRRVTAFADLLTEATLTVELRWEAGEPTAQLDDDPIFIGVAVAG